MSDDIFSQFEDVDVSEEVSNPDAITTGTYTAEITGTEVKKTKKGDKVGLTIKVTTDNRDGSESGEEFEGTKLQMWQQLVTKDVADAAAAGDKQAQRTKYYFQQLMSNLGITTDQLKTINQELFDSLEGLPVTIKVNGASKDSPYPQIASIAIDKGDFDEWES